MSGRLSDSEFFSSSLPIDTVLPQLRQLLYERDEVVLEAPPGAGKTTRLPLALLEEPWLAGQKIVMLEPRRLAARAAAERLAAQLGERAGETVGYRVRLETRVGKNTRIEVVTEGILTRLLQSDPSLDGVGLLIFDEFHERSLDADLGLALALQGRELFREGPALKLLIMSATLDGANVAQLLSDASLGAAPVVRSEGRQYPVEVRYGNPAQVGEPVTARTVAAVRTALRESSGSILVFLPGQAEIRTVQSALEAELAASPADGVVIAPLYGDLDLAAQRKAIAPPAAGLRKVVLATSIAESSLTIEGIAMVIDTGLSRLPSFDPKTGMTRLETRRLSRAASVQRAGRAGRLQAGICYRLWSASQQDQLAAYTPAEISQADLAPLALQLLSWGVDDPAELKWLDPPSAAPFNQALDLLSNLGAAARTDSGGWQLTAHGRAMAEIPAHPRLAHMLLLGQRFGLRRQAVALAALLSERDPLPGGDADIGQRLELLRGAHESGRGSRGANVNRAVVQRLRRQCEYFERLCRDAPESPVADAQSPRWIGFLLACAYPDRIALERRGGQLSQEKDYRLANGRAARLCDADPLQQHGWLVAAHLGGRQGTRADRIFLAAPLDPLLFEGPLAERVTHAEKVEWDAAREQFIAQRQRRVGSLVLSSEPIGQVSPEARREVLLDVVRQRGLTILPWTEELQQWRARVRLLFEINAGSGNWPDLGDEKLLQTLEPWLGPYLDNITRLSDFANLDLKNILMALLPWPLPQELEQLAPTHIQVPSGSRIAIDYCPNPPGDSNPPVLAVRLQEMFGCEQTPRIAGGRVRLMVHLLSPARRPLQVTQDLASFWRNGYNDVKKEMKGRYPKHYWPDDPLQAEATARAKPRKGIR